jgi:4-amino-4-deoxy-L-arabinose transferase-like glycosyltransferase
MESFPSESPPTNLTLNARTYLFAILLLAALLRFYGLGTESLWLDEGVTIRLTSLPYLCVAENGTQGPLFLLVTKVMRDLFGLSEFVLRFLPAVFGVACVLAAYQLARRLFDETTGLVAALLMSVNPFLIQYSQDARPYTLFLFGALGSLYFVLQLAARGGWRDVAGYALATGVAFYSHPFGVFLFPAHAAAFLLWLPGHRRDARARPVRRAGFAVAAAGLICLPQLARYGWLFVHKACGGKVARWIPYTDLHDLAATAARYFAWPRLSLFVVAIVLLALLWRPPRREQWISLGILAVVGIFCTVLPWAISLGLAPIYQARYGIPGVAALVLAAAWALTVFPRSLRIVLLAATLALTVVPLHSYYTKLDKDPWRQTAGRLRSLVLPRDTVIEYPDWTDEPLNFYLRDDSSIHTLKLFEDADVRPLICDAGQIWLVRSYRPDNFESEPLLFAALAETHIADSVIRVNDGLVRNPWAIHVVEISILRFRPKVAS